MNEDFKHLQLTEKDFQILVEALDYLPNKNAAGQVMSDILLTLLAPNKEAEEKIISHREKRNLDKKKDNELLTEEVKILQGKLLMLKRYLKENGALDEFYGIINK